MTFLPRIFGLALAAALVPAGGAAALTATERDFIAASCSGAAFSCAFVVRQNIDRLRASGLTGPALDAQLGRIAAVVAAQVSPGVPQTVRAELSEALGAVAENVSDTEQRAATANAASTILDSAVETEADLPPLDVSPG